MFGKSTRNNKFAIVTKQVPRYGLRKFNFGVASVLLGTTIFMGGAMTTQVKAETVTPDQQPKIEVVSKDDNSAAERTAGESATKETAVNQTPASQSEQLQAEDAKADPTGTSEVVTDQAPAEQNEQAKAEKPETEESKDSKSNSNELNKNQAPVEQKKQDENTAPDTKVDQISAKEKSTSDQGSETVYKETMSQDFVKDPTFEVVKNPRDVDYKGHTYHLEGRLDKINDDGSYESVSDEELLRDLDIPSVDISNEELEKLGLKPNEFYVYTPKGTFKQFINSDDIMIVLQNDNSQIVITNIAAVHNSDGSIKQLEDPGYARVIKYNDTEGEYVGGRAIVKPDHPDYGFTDADLNRTITRTINVHNPNEKVDTTTQEVHFSRTGLIDLNYKLIYDKEGHIIGVAQGLTKKGYDNNEDGIAEYTMVQGDQAWQTSKNSFDEFTAPTIKGYVPSIAIVKSEIVTPETANSVINITYTELKHDTGDPTVDPENPSVKPEQPVTPPEDKPEQPKIPSVKPELPSIPDTNETIATDTSTNEPEQTVAGPVKAENPAAISTKKAPAEKQAPSENVAPKPIAEVQPNQKAQATTVKAAVVKSQNNQQASEKLPQTGSDHEVASLLSVLGITLLSGLGLIWFSRKKEN
ncbi:MAG: YSIRK-type signal peptide-containing protein [Lactobacillus sp.]